jgi:hypothetical protein
MPSFPPTSDCAASGPRAALACVLAMVLAAGALAAGLARADDTPAPAAQDGEGDAAAKAEEAEEAAAGLVPNWRPKFDALYRLADGEDAKLIAPPFSAERNAMHLSRGEDLRMPGQYWLTWRNGRTDLESWSFTSSPGTVASGLLQAGIDPVDLEGPPDLLDLPAPGDWIVREGADRAALLAAVRRELVRATNGAVRIEPARRVKDVIVARGRFEFKSLNFPGRHSKAAVQVFADKREPSGGGSTTVSGLLRKVADRMGQKILDETEPHDGYISWEDHRSSQGAKAGTPLGDELLKNVARQTSLEFRVERREVDVWVVGPDPGKAGGL